VTWIEFVEPCGPASWISLNRLIGVLIKSV
jgi:hypothetical protein